MGKGKCYVVGTPIGNLEDMTFRGIRVLKEVDLIAAEDTRTTIKLLNYFDIKTKMNSYHKHNEKSQSEILVNKLKEGINIAIVSDAGMPGISDPGFEIINKCIQEDIQVEVIPGPSALLCGLVISGIDTSKFFFEGFLPKENKERSNILTKLKYVEETIILYEAPHKLLKTLEDIKNNIGDRRISIAREITKRHQEVFRGIITEAIEYFINNEPKGEFVLIVEGCNILNNDIEDWQNISIEEHLAYYLKDGLSKKDAVKLISKDRGIPKKEVYQYIMIK